MYNISAFALQLLALTSGVLAANNFINPPIPGGPRDYRDNQQHRLGDVLKIKWQVDLAGVGLVLFFPIAHETKGSAYTQTISRNITKQNFDWVVNLDGISEAYKDIESDGAAVVYLGMWNADGGEVFAKTHYFNITAAAPIDSKPQPQPQPNDKPSSTPPKPSAEDSKPSEAPSKPSATPSSEGTSTGVSNTPRVSSTPNVSAASNSSPSASSSTAVAGGSSGGSAGGSTGGSSSDGSGNGGSSNSVTSGGGSNSGSSNGAVIGGAVGGALGGLLILSTLAFFIYRQRNKSKAAGAVEMPAPDNEKAYYGAPMTSVAATPAGTAAGGSPMLLRNEAKGTPSPSPSQAMTGSVVSTTPQPEAPVGELHGLPVYEMYAPPPPPPSR